MESPIKPLLARHSRRALAAAVLLCVVFMGTGAPSVGKGLLLGTLFSILNFILMGHLLPLAVTTDARQRRMLTYGSILLRHMILAIPLIAAAVSLQFHLMATIVGLFAVQLAILAELPLKRVLTR